MEVSGQLHALGRFTPRERALGTLWIRGWVGCRACLDTVVKWKNFQPLPELEPLIIQPIVQCYTTELSWLLYSNEVHIIQMHSLLLCIP
jgi:hypothetical protein